jgi:hypothetical protein
MIFPSPAGMSLIKLSLDGKNLIIPVQGEFDHCHPGWGRENGKSFFTVYAYAGYKLVQYLYPFKDKHTLHLFTLRNTYLKYAINSH